MNIFKEIGLFLFQPLYQLTAPSSAGKKAEKRFVVQGGLYALFITALMWAGIWLISPAVKKMGDLQYGALLLGGISLPLFMVIIGILLHFNKPAQAKEHRFLKMLAVPWHVCASFFTAMLLSIVASTLSNLGNKSPVAVSDHISTMVFLIAAVCALVFVNLLKNIRETSFLQNTGDVFVIYGIVLIPYAFLSISK